MDTFHDFENLPQLQMSQAIEDSLKNEKNTEHLTKFKNLSLVLKLTNRCNLACAYCYVNSHPKAEGDMTFDTAKRAIEMSLAGTEGPVDVLLHGGEPLLRLDLIETIVEHFGSRVSFSIQTNATIITPKIAQYLKDNCINVGISVDGPPQIHDKWRYYGNSPTKLGSYKHVERGIRHLQEADVALGVYVVVTRDSINHLEQIGKMLVELGIYSFSLEAMNLSGRASTMNNDAPSADEYFKAKQRFIEWIIEYNKSQSDKKISEREIHWMLHNILHKSRGFMCLKAPCGAGTNHLGVSTSGKVYICDTLHGNPDYIVGHIHDPRSLNEQVLHNPITIAFQKRVAGTLPFCGNCNLRTICSQGCAAVSIAQHNDIYAHPPMCDYYKQVYPYLIGKLAEGIATEIIS